MENLAKLVTAVAQLVTASAWPVVVILIVLIFRDELKPTVGKFQNIVERFHKFKFPWLEVELDRVADSEVGKTGNDAGQITSGQLKAAAKLEVKTQEISSEALLREMKKLSSDYDSIRQTMPSGSNRTREMTRVLVKMRSLAPSIDASFTSFKNSDSAGERLAAIAAMQMTPESADLHWLEERFTVEQPFLFYQAALALQVVADRIDNPVRRQLLVELAQRSLVKVKSFSGIADRNTIEVLETLIANLQR